MKILISHDRLRIKALMRGLADTKQVSKAVNRSIKRTMKGVQTFAIRQLRQNKILKMTPAKWKDDVRIYFGGGASSPVAEQYGKIWFTSYPQPLGRFYAKKKFVGLKKNKPFKGQRLYSVSLNQYGAPYLKDPKNSFIVTKPNGPLVFRSLGNRRLEKQFGEGLSDLLRRTGLIEPIEKYIDDRYQREFAQNIKFYVEKAASKK